MPQPTKNYNLQVTNPTLAKEWHPKKNGDLTPKDVTPGSNKVVWWICKRGHEWQTSVSHRNKGYNCLDCWRVDYIEKKTSEKLRKRKRPSKQIKRGIFHKVGETPSGNVLVEMSPDLWKKLAEQTLTTEDLATAIIKYRKENRLSQQEFAEKVGISRNLVLRIENGQSQGMHHQTYQRIISTIF